MDGLYSALISDRFTSSLTLTYDRALSNSQLWRQVLVNGQPLSPMERVYSVSYAQIPDGSCVIVSQDTFLFPSGGADTLHITGNADGVALAAIQALAKENAEIKRQNEELRNELESIKRYLGL